MSGYKPILPAYGPKDDGSEVSTSGTTGGSNATNSSESAFDLEAAGATTSATTRDEEKPKRKRKVQGKVAVIACLECRRTRSRCDGEPPNPCQRCRIRGFRCVYQPHTKIQKDEILNDLEQERARTESLSQRNHELSLILQVISGDGHLEEIVQRLRRKEDAKSIATWLSSLPELQLSIRRSSAGISEAEEVVDSLIQTYSIDIPEQDDRVRMRWTRVTSNSAFIGHLVKLYLDWVHPNCMLFNEMAFAKAYFSGDDSTCSKALVNAICALACNILDRRYIGHETDAANVVYLYEAFLAEARSAITPADSMNITTIQALAVMFLAEFSNGKARSAAAYLKSADECLRRLEAEAEAVISPDLDLSRWSIHSLHTEFCAFTCQNPCSPQTINPSVIFDRSRELLQELTQDSESKLGKSPKSLRLAIDIAGVKARLCGLVHKMIGLYGGSQGRITPQAILILYKQYIELFKSMPSSIRQNDRLDLGIDIISLCLMFYCMVSSLWLPLISYAQDKRNHPMFLACRDLMLESSRKGLDIAEAASQSSNCETLLPQYLYCVVQVCDAVARWSDNKEEQSRSLRICFSILGRNDLNFRLCRVLGNLVRMEFDKVIEPALLEDLKKQHEAHDSYTIEDVFDATTRLTYVTSFPFLKHLLDAKFQQEWERAWRAFLADSAVPAKEPSSGTNVMRIEDLCD